MTYYISLYIEAKRLVFYLSHVIIVSGCLILTAVNLIVLIRMAYITKRLVKLCKIYCDIWHRLTWSVCTDGRTLRHNQIFWDGWFTKFSYPWCSAARALRGRGSSANISSSYSQIMHPKSITEWTENPCLMPGYAISADSKGSIDRRYFCLQCNGIFRDPVQTDCGHVYCKSCISDLKR